MSLQHPEKVTKARKVLEEASAGHDDMCPDFGQAVKLRAALEAALDHCDELLAIVRQRVDDIEAMDRYRAAMETVGRL